MARGVFTAETVDTEQLQQYISINSMSVPPTEEEVNNTSICNATAMLWSLQVKGKFRRGLPTVMIAKPFHFLHEIGMDVGVIRNGTWRTNNF